MLAALAGLKEKPPTMFNIAIKLYNSSLLCHSLDFGGLLRSYSTHELNFYVDKHMCFAHLTAVCTLLHKQPKRAYYCTVVSEVVPDTFFVFCSFAVRMDEVSNVSICFCKVHISI